LGCESKDWEKEREPRTKYTRKEVQVNQNPNNQKPDELIVLNPSDEELATVLAAIAEKFGGIALPAMSIDEVVAFLEQLVENNSSL
jgi:hypothetical protein